MASRVDANQAEIVKALRDVGAHVRPTHMVGAGFPDLVAVFRGVVYLIEIKDGKKIPSKRRLTADEQAYHVLVAQQGGYTIPVVETAEQALRVLGLVE
jgi:Holliday junction resolvase